MFDLVTKNTIIGVLITIVLGAIGSGLWDIAIKPLFKILSRTILKLCTFGITKLRSPIYKRIATGKAEIILNIYMFVIITMFLIPLFFITDSSMQIKRDIRSYNYQVVQQLDFIKDNVPLTYPNQGNNFLSDFLNIKELRKISNDKKKAYEESSKIIGSIMGKYATTEDFKKLKEKDKEKLISLKKTVFSYMQKENILFEGFFKKTQLLLLIISIFPFIFLVYPAIKSAYINEAVAYYNQVLRICKPFISQSDYDEFNSKFSLIKSREDFLELITRLVDIAKENNIVPERFNVL